MVVEKTEYQNPPWTSLTDEEKEHIENTQSHRIANEDGTFTSETDPGAPSTMKYDTFVDKMMDYRKKYDNMDVTFKADNPDAEGDDSYTEISKWKVYTIGNYDLDTLAKPPAEESARGAGFAADDGFGKLTGINSDFYNAIPSEHQVSGDENKFMKPQAGITSLQSQTEGDLGWLKKTTVNFVIHNFHDF